MHPIAWTLHWSQLWPRLQGDCVMGCITQTRHVVTFNASDWLRYKISPTYDRIVALRHQTFTLTSDKLSSARSTDINLREISQTYLSHISPTFLFKLLLPNFAPISPESMSCWYHFLYNVVIRVHVLVCNFPKKCDHCFSDRNAGHLS